MRSGGRDGEEGEEEEEEKGGGVGGLGCVGLGVVGFRAGLGGGMLGVAEGEGHIKRVVGCWRELGGEGVDGFLWGRRSGRGGGFDGR